MHRRYTGNGVRVVRDVICSFKRFSTTEPSVGQSINTNRKCNTEDANSENLPAAAK